MEKSIESIWKNGFLQEEIISPIKINELYNQKSMLISDKLKRTSKWDLLSGIPIILLFVGIFLYQGQIAVAILAAVTFSSVLLVSWYKYKLLPKFEEYSNCYQYLNSLQSNLNTTVKQFTILLGVVMPLLVFMGQCLYFGWQHVFAHHMYVAIPALSLWGMLSYRLMVKLVYGKLLTKIKDAIADMEELKKQG